MRKIALARWDIGFTLSHNGKQVFSLPAGHGVEAGERRVLSVLGAEFMENALFVSREAAGLSLQGWISRPVFSRSQADQQYFYVNDRIVRDRTISHAVKLAFADKKFAFASSNVEYHPSPAKAKEGARQIAIRNESE